jgi:phosphatidylinositol N-acetylglucosaminyltransferase subunit H
LQWLTLIAFLSPCSEESLLVIRGLGIQTSTSWAMYWSTAATRFIPTTQIQDIVIHEAFKGFEVRFYLAVIVEGEPNAVVVFPVSGRFPA